MIDPFHLEAYGEVAINYNRDIEAFPLLRRIIEKITGKESTYKSPTDMGVNRVGYGITDDAIVREASEQEIIRRYFKTRCEYKKGYIDKEALNISKRIMDDVNLKETDRKVVEIARQTLERVKEENSECDGINSTLALELPNGHIVTGKHSETMDAPSAAILNAIKYLAHLDDDLHILSPIVLNPILKLKSVTLKNRVTSLDCEDILITLSICAATNPAVQLAMDKLSLLKGGQAHSTTILGKNDEQIFRKLGIDVTCDPEFPTENLYYNE